MWAHSLLGKGIWIRRIADCEGGDLAAIVAHAQAAGFSHVFLQIADGADPYNFDNETQIDWAARLTRRLRAVGIRVWGVHYLYGDRPLFKGSPQPDYHLREADQALQRVESLRASGLQGYVLDAAGEYEVIPDRYAKATAFMTALRAQSLGDFPIALSAWKYPNSHRNFPWAEFRAQCDLDLPQVFWIGRHGETVRQLETSHRQYTDLQPHRPYLPVGPAFAENNWRPSPDELTTFFEKAQTLGLPAASVWCWDQLGLKGDNPRELDLSALWQAVAKVDWPLPVGYLAPAHFTAAEDEPPVPPSLEPEAALTDFSALETAAPPLPPPPPVIPSFANFEESFDDAFASFAAGEESFAPTPVAASTFMPARATSPATSTEFDFSDEPATPGESTPSENEFSEPTTAELQIGAARDLPAKPNRDLPKRAPARPTSLPSFDRAPREPRRVPSEPMLDTSKASRLLRHPVRTIQRTPVKPLKLVGGEPRLQTSVLLSERAAPPRAAQPLSLPAVEPDLDLEVESLSLLDLETPVVEPERLRLTPIRDVEHQRLAARSLPPIVRTRPVRPVRLAHPAPDQTLAPEPSEWATLATADLAFNITSGPSLIAETDQELPTTPLLDALEEDDGQNLYWLDFPDETTEIEIADLDEPSYALSETEVELDSLTSEEEEMPEWLAFLDDSAEVEIDETDATAEAEPELDFAAIAEVAPDEEALPEWLAFLDDSAEVEIDESDSNAQADDDLEPMALADTTPEEETMPEWLAFLNDSTEVEIEGTDTESDSEAELDLVALADVAPDEELLPEWLAFLDDTTEVEIEGEAEPSAESEAEPELMALADAAPDAELLPEWLAFLDNATEVEIEGETEPSAESDAEPELIALADVAPDAELLPEWLAFLDDTTEVEIEGEAEPSAESEAEPELMALADTAPDAELLPEWLAFLDDTTEVEIEGEAEPSAESEAETELMALADVAPDAELLPEWLAFLDDTTEVEIEGEAEPSAESDVEPELMALADAAPDAELLPEWLAFLDDSTEVEIETDAEIEAQPNTEAELEPDLSALAETTPDAELLPEWLAFLDATTEVEIEAEPNLEVEPELEFVSLTETTLNEELMPEWLAFLDDETAEVAIEAEVAPAVEAQVEPSAPPQPKPSREPMVEKPIMRVYRPEPLPKPPALKPGLLRPVPPALVVSVPPPAVIEDAISDFYTALREERWADLAHLYSPQFSHLTADRVIRQPEAMRAFYQAFAQQINLASLTWLVLRRQRLAITVQWVATSLTGEPVQGREVFHLNRYGQIVFQQVGEVFNR